MLSVVRMMLGSLDGVDEIEERRSGRKGET
eukprot:COSAG06_NODE_64199_length_260_cov_0.639752_1_plen_29_part_10